jgi:hypothetical protein
VLHPTCSTNSERATRTSPSFQRFPTRFFHVLPPYRKSSHDTTFLSYQLPTRAYTYIPTTTHSQTPTSKHHHGQKPSKSSPRNPSSSSALASPKPAPPPATASSEILEIYPEIVMTCTIRNKKCVASMNTIPYLPHTSHPIHAQK